MRTLMFKSISENETIEEEIELFFSDEEIRIIDHFLGNVERIRTARILESGLPYITNINWDEGSGFTFEFSEFDYRDIHELLHVARPMLLAKEPASFEKICALFGKKGKGTSLPKHLKGLRNLYEKGEYQPYFQITVDGTPLFHDKTLKTWLYGVEYHQDSEKRKQIMSLEQALSENMARGVFVSQLSGKIKSIFLLSNLANLVSEK